MKVFRMRSSRPADNNIIKYLHKANRTENTAKCVLACEKEILARSYKVQFLRSVPNNYSLKIYYNERTFQFNQRNTVRDASR